jgi:hypothetical protein
MAARCGYGDGTYEGEVRAELPPEDAREVVRALKKLACSSTAKAFERIQAARELREWAFAVLAKGKTGPRKPAHSDKGSAGDVQLTDDDPLHAVPAAPGPGDVASVSPSVASDNPAAAQAAAGLAAHLRAQEAADEGESAPTSAGEQ